MTLTDELVKEVVQTAGSGDNKFIAELEGILSRPLEDGTRDTLGDRLHKAVSGDTYNTKYREPDSKFLTLLAVNLAATAYYAGLLARDMPVSYNEIKLAFAGNGSKMLKWIGTDNQVSDFLRVVFLMAKERNPANKEVSDATTKVN